MSENKFISRLKGKTSVKSLVEIQKSEIITPFSNIPNSTPDSTFGTSDSRDNSVVMAKSAKNWIVNNSALSLSNNDTYLSEFDISGNTLWLNSSYIYPASTNPDNPVVEIIGKSSKWVLRLCGKNLLSSNSTISFTLAVKVGATSISHIDITTEPQAGFFCKQFEIDFSESDSDLIKVSGGESLVLQLLCNDATANATIYNGKTVLTLLQAKVDGEVISSNSMTFDDLEKALDDTDETLAEHIADADNPHATTAAQVGAYTTGETNDLLDGKADLSGATFTGAISATNLSGTNTGDQDLSSYAIDDEVVHLAGTETITGAKSFSEAITATGGFKDADVSTAIKLGDSGNAVPTTGNKTIVGAINELNTKTSGGGVAPLPTYLTAVPSSIVGTYNQLNYSLPVSEIILNATVNNNEALIKSFIYGIPLDTTTIPAGNWVFNVFTYVSATTQTTTIRAEIFKRTSGGAETTLFAVSSNDINLTSVGQIKLESFQNAFTVNATDYLGARFYAITTAPIDIMVYLYTGDGNPTYITTPLALRHDLLRDIKYVSDNVSGALHLTNGADTIYGVKTFNASPIVPTPTTDYQAATKKYVDDNGGGGGGSAILPAGTCSTAGATAAKEVTVAGYTEAAGACALITFENKNYALGPNLYIPFTGGTAADPIGVYTLTTIGSPTYTGDKFNSNGNSGLSYNITSLGSGAWCIQGLFKSTNTTTYQTFVDANEVRVGVLKNTNNKLEVYLSSNGTSSNIANGTQGSKSDWGTGTEYYIRLRFTGTHYYIDWSTDGTNWTNDIDITSSASIFSPMTGLRFGILGANSTPLIGTMDDLYVTIGSATTITDYPTLNINSGGAKPILHADGTRVTPANPAYFVANCPIEFWYDGTGYRFKQELVKTYVNGTTWYNLRNNGWVEQGGTTTSNSTYAGVSVTLPVEMADANYSITTSIFNAANNNAVPIAQVRAMAVDTITVTAKYQGGNASAGFDGPVIWKIEGMAA